jgi:hypothetical protein
MFKSFKVATLIGGSSGIVVLGLGGMGFAAITGNLGTTSVSYGPALAIQTVQTQFGTSPGGGDATGGSELDAVYGNISGGNLNLFLAGCFENNGNHLNVFLADGRPGQSVLNASVGPSNASNGSAFSPGFLATYEVDTNDYQGTFYTDVADLVNPSNSGYQGSVYVGGGGIGSGTLTNGIAMGINNTLDSNTSGVGGGTGAANQANAAAVTTGLEMSIPLSLLGNATGPIEVLAGINGGGDGYFSNQFLPGLPPGTSNLGGGGPYTGPNSGTFNFSSLPGEFVTVSVPEPTSMCLLGGTAMMLCIRRRKA